MNTLLLDKNTWDLTLDSSGNMALATGSYALAQDVASEIRTFQGECYYDTTKGIPYWTRVFNGKLPPLSYLREQFVQKALSVPGVVTAEVYFSSIENRVVTGQVQITDKSGITSVATF